MLRVVVPGRWTPAFWLMLLFTFLFVTFAFGMTYSFALATNAFERFLPLWGVVCFVWFFFVFRARTETVTLGPDFLETRGSFVPLMPRKAATSEIRGFVLKPVSPQHLMEGPLIFYGFQRRKLLFAEAPRELALAVQAEDAEFQWLRGILESHHRSLRTAGAGE